IIMKDIGVNVWQLFDHRGRKDIDFQAITNEQKHTLVLGKTSAAASVHNLAHIPFWEYDKGTEQLYPISTLIILEMPDSLEQLQSIIEKTKPSNIHVCYIVENSVYMQTFPAREDFIWFYSLVQKRKALDLKKELKQIMKQKKWTKERIIFIAQVFQELEFVNLKNGVVYIVSDPVKKDL